MKHFLDHTQNVSKQCFDTAVITDSKGKKVGKIIIRYTNSQIGYNNQTGILFYAGEGRALDFGTTVKGSTYNKDGVFTLLSSIGAKVYGFNDLQFYDYNNKLTGDNTQSVDSISRCTEFLKFKIGNSVYNILWV